MKKNKSQEILKIPASLDDFKYRKGTQDWGMTFSLESANLQYGKPLMDCIGRHFVLYLIPITAISDLESAMGRGIEDLKLDEEDL